MIDAHCRVQSSRTTGHASVWSHKGSTTANQEITDTDTEYGVHRGKFDRKTMTSNANTEKYVATIVLQLCTPSPTTSRETWAVCSWWRSMSDITSNGIRTLPPSYFNVDAEFSLIHIIPTKHLQHTKKTTRNSSTPPSTALTSDSRRHSTAHSHFLFVNVPDATPETGPGQASAAN